LIAPLQIRHIRRHQRILAGQQAGGAQYAAGGVAEDGGGRVVAALAGQGALQ